MYSYFLNVADDHQCSKMDFPYLLFFVCLLYDLLSCLFHCRLCIWYQHCLGWVIFCLCFSVSRGMRLWETDLQSLLNHTQLSISEVRWSELHSEFILLSSQVLTWESLVLTGFVGLLEESCLTDTLCRETRQRVLAFTSKENWGKSFLEILSSEGILAQSCNRVQNSVLSPAISKNWICLCLRCFGFSPILLARWTM